MLFPTVLALAKHADENRLFFRERAGSWDTLLKARPDQPLQLPRSGWIHPFLKNLFGLALRLAFRVRVEGLPNLPEKGTCILVANHQSYDRVVATCRIGGRSIGDLLKAAGNVEGGNGYDQRKS